MPDPTRVMTEEFRSHLERLLSQGAHEELRDAVEEAQDRVFGDGLRMTDSEPAYEGKAPPTGLLRDPVESVEDLALAIERVDLRWRLDAILALDDFID